MRPEATCAILLSAFAHVYWNYQIKRSKSPALASWWVMALGSVLALPVGLALTGFSSLLNIPVRGWLCVAGTGTVYALYFYFISESYRRADLSRAYPIARGVAPLATALFGLAWFAERPSSLGWAGIVAISGGVLLLARGGADNPNPRGIAFAVATGLCTSAYSAIDKIGVSLVHPALYISLTFGLGSLAQAWLQRHHHDPSDYFTLARAQPWLIFTSGLASVGGYLLVLLVLRTAPVSYVVPLRSLSVVLSVLVGGRMLGEAGSGPRLLCAALVVAGIVAIALGG